MQSRTNSTVHGTVPNTQQWHCSFHATLVPSRIHDGPLPGKFHSGDFEWGLNENADNLNPVFVALNVNLNNLFK